MALIKNAENERCKKEIMEKMDLFNVPQKEGDCGNLDCIYYDFYHHTIHRNRGLGMHIRDVKKGEVGNTFDYYDNIFQTVRNVTCSDVIALVYDGVVIYQNDDVVTKNLEDIEEKTRETLWNRKILDARDNKTGRISIPKAMTNEKVREPKQKQRAGLEVEQEVKKDRRLVTIAVSRRNAELDVHDVKGVSGSFNIITMPEGIIADDKDLGGYKLLVRDVHVKEDGVVEAKFAADMMLTLTDTMTGKRVKVSAGEINEGLCSLYLKSYIESKERDRMQNRELGRERI